MDFMMPCKPLEEPPWGFLKKKKNVCFRYVFKGFNGCLFILKF